MIELCVIGASRTIDGRGDLDEVERLRNDLARRGLRVHTINLAPARMGWGSPLPDGFFRGACAPIEAMIAAREQLAAGTADALVIRGADALRSELRGDGRRCIQDIYGAGQSFLEGYARLTDLFLERAAIPITTFRRCRDALFENYWRTWSALHPTAQRPDTRWFELVTPLFRGVDCANPHIDFSGALIVCSESTAAACTRDSRDVVRVRAAAVERCGEDGLAWLNAIADYNHLSTVIADVCARVGLDIRRELADGRLLLEVYSCFPVVPIAFLLRSGAVDRADAIPDFLARWPVTFTGGLNLARAPWNNTTLSTLVDLVHRLRRTPRGTLGMVHSLAALGYKQAAVVFEKG